MVSVHEYLDKAATARKRYSDSWKNLGRMLQGMIIGQTSVISGQISQFTSLINEIADVHSRLAAEELRNAEDFRDIFERYEVMYRANTEYSNAKTLFLAASKDLESARKKNETEKTKPDYEAKRRVKLEAEIEKGKSAKAKYLELVKTNLANLITQREKYDKFKVRRLCEGWTRYGHALKIESENESAIIDRIQECLAEMKGQNSVNPENLAQIETALQKHIEEAPQPEFTPTPVEPTPAPAAPVQTTTYEAPKEETHYEAPAPTPAYTEEPKIETSYEPQKSYEYYSEEETKPVSGDVDVPTKSPFDTGSADIDIPTTSPFGDVGGDDIDVPTTSPFDTY
jgi:hypothetical protein